MVSLAELDETRDRLRQATDTVATALMAAESDPNRAVLEQAPLSGHTAVRWAEARTGLERLWAWFTHLQEMLARVDQVRGKRSKLDRTRLQELEGLLNGPSIELTIDEVPSPRLDDDGAAASMPYKAAELLDLMSTSLDEVLVVLHAAGAAWSGLLPRIDVMQSELGGIEQSAKSLGDSERDDIESLHGRVTEMATRLLCDPLVVEEDDVDELESAIHAVRDDLGSVAALRTRIDDELDRTRALLSDLEASVADCTKAQTEVKRKIVQADLPPPPHIDRSLGRQLNQVTDLVARGQWRDVARDMANVQMRAQARLDEARRIVEESRAPIRARNELRGRLDAYRAKAQQVGCLEDTKASRAYDQARRVLYTAPTDLVTATEVVERYQEFVSQSARPREVPR
jgi:hypothetical protein